LHHFDTDHECVRQIDGQTPRPWLRRTKHSAIARKKWRIFTMFQVQYVSSDTRLVHRVVCLFTPQLSLVLIAPIHGGMAKLG